MDQGDISMAQTGRMGRNTKFVVQAIFIWFACIVPAWFFWDNWPTWVLVVYLACAPMLLLVIWSAVKRDSRREGH